MLNSDRIGLKAAQPFNLQIGLKGMAASGRWSIAESGLRSCRCAIPCADQRRLRVHEDKMITGIFPDRSSRFNGGTKF
jgi:hypothetical protein